jgi:hypothetical protein
LYCSGGDYPSATRKVRRRSTFFQQCFEYGIRPSRNCQHPGENYHWCRSGVHAYCLDACSSFADGLALSAAIDRGGKRADAATNSGSTALSRYYGSGNCSFAGYDQLIRYDFGKSKREATGQDPDGQTNTETEVTLRLDLMPETRGEVKVQNALKLKLTTERTLCCFSELATGYTIYTACRSGGTGRRARLRAV